MQFIEDRLIHFNAEIKQYSALKKWVDAAAGIYELEAARRRGKLLKGPVIAANLNQMAGNISHISTLLLRQDIRFARTDAIRAKIILKEQQKASRHVYRFFKNYDSEFT